MAQQASLSQEATSCGAKSTGSGDQGPDPVLPLESTGSDLGHFPSILSPPLPHPHCARLRSKGSVQPWPLEILHCCSHVFPPELSEEEAASPSSVGAHINRKGQMGPLLLPSAHSYSSGPRTSPPHSHIFHSLPRARYPLGQRP